MQIYKAANLQMRPNIHKVLFAINETVDQVFSPLFVLFVDSALCPNKIKASKKRFSNFTFSSNDNYLRFENSGEVCEKMRQKIKSIKEITFMVFIILSNVLCKLNNICLLYSSYFPI